MIDRLERILRKLAQAHNMHLPTGGNRLVQLDTIAHELAVQKNVLVIVGELPEEAHNMRDIYVQDWVNGYGQLYRTLADTLFATWSKLEATDADHQIPPIATIEGEASPLFPVFYEHIIPYLVERQPYRDLVKDFELRGFLDSILMQELYADNLERNQYDGLLSAGVVAIRQMLNAPVRHIQISKIKPPPPPPGLPKTGELKQPKPRQQPVQPPPEPEPQSRTIPQDHTPTEELFTVDIPIWRSDSKRVPPVPGLPKEDDNNKNGRR